MEGGQCAGDCVYSAIPIVRIGLREGSACYDRTGFRIWGYSTLQNAPGVYSNNALPSRYVHSPIITNSHRTLPVHPQP